jgi:hypothetical protein
MAGRDYVPGEDTTGYDDLRDHARYFSRIVRGRLTSPDTSIGSCQVNTLEIFGTRNVTIPALWFSGQGRSTAWGRYMPFGNEDVHIAYRNDDTAVVLGYNINYPDEKPSEGYPQLKKFADEGKAGYAVFRELKPGEFDFKSSGDAYIHGSNQGTLYLSGGQAFIKLDKQAYRLESKAAEYHYLSETSEIRFGTVFRKILPTDQAESPVSSGIYKESLIDVNFAVAGVPAVQSRAKLHMGDILNGVNVPETGPYGSPLRFRLSLGDGMDLSEVFGCLIDNNGNVEITQKEPASGLNNTLSWQIGGTTITVNGSDGEFFIKQSGVTQVAVAIAEHLEALWGQMVQAATAFDAHTHPTGVGPSGPATPPSNYPAWDSNINSLKMLIPDN